MSKNFSESFKIQAVQKALSRPRDVSLREVAEPLGISISSLQKWIHQSKNQKLQSIPCSEQKTT